MTVDLTIAERLLALSELPAKASLVQLRVITEAQAALGFTSDEVKEFGLSTEVRTTDKGDQMFSTWDPKFAEEVRSIALTTAAVEILRKRLDDMDQKAELTVQHISLYEKMHIAEAIKP